MHLKVNVGVILALTPPNECPNDNDWSSARLPLASALNKINGGLSHTKSKLVCNNNNNNNNNIIQPLKLVAQWNWLLCNEPTHRIMITFSPVALVGASYLTGRRPFNCHSSWPRETTTFNADFNASDCVRGVAVVMQFCTAKNIATSKQFYLDSIIFLATCKILEKIFAIFEDETRNSIVFSFCNRLEFHCELCWYMVAIVMLLRFQAATQRPK